MQTYTLTPADVVAVWAATSEAFDSRFAGKGDSELMKRAAFLLQLAGVLDAERFLERFATTIGSRIYLPWVPGAVGPGVPSLWSQVDTCVHEHVHVEQWRRDPAEFVYRYTQPDGRALLEADAIGAELEVQWWRGDEDLNGHILRAVDGLKAYALGVLDRAIAREALLMRAEMIRQGGRLSPVADCVARFLEVRFGGGA